MDNTRPEVEEQLTQHTLFFQAIVVGVSSPETNQRVAVLIVAKKYGIRRGPQLGENTQMASGGARTQYI